VSAEGTPSTYPANSPAAGHRGALPVFGGQILIAVQVPEEEKRIRSPEHSIVLEIGDILSSAEDAYPLSAVEHRSTRCRKAFVGSSDTS